MCSTLRTSLAAALALACGVALSPVFFGCSPPPARSSVGRTTSGVAKKPKAAAAPQRTQPSSEIPTTVEPFKLPDKEIKFQLTPEVSLELVGIPTGEFMMGNNRLGVRRHKETIAKPFYLGKFEVTQEQWQAVMGSNPSLNKGNPKRPVERVNWSDIQTFLAKLNEKFAASGMKFGLPTEAQWEWSCRAGATMRLESTDNPDKIDEYGWFSTNSQLETHPVGEKKPNPWGLYDMHGNVAEFCADNATNMADEDAREGGDGEGSDFRAVRGGNWKNSARESTSMSRGLRRGTATLRFDGFRVMCEPK